MSVARILERWEIPVEGEQSGGTQWFLDWATRSPREVSKHLTAGWHAYRLLQTTYGSSCFRSALEFFGGMGGQSLMIQELFEPEQHAVADFSPEAVRHLSSLFQGSSVAVDRRDAYAQFCAEYADLIGLDFGDFTVWRHREGEKHRKLLDEVVSVNPRAIVMTDIAGPRLHLQRERYETILGPGSCESHETYLEALVDLIYQTHGYRLLGGFYHRWSAVMVLVPGNRERGLWLPVPSSPVGLELR